MKITDLRKKIENKLKDIKEQVNTVKEEPRHIRPVKKDHNENDNVIWIDIKATTIIKSVVLIILMYYLWSVISQISTLIIILLISLILSAGISPIVDWMQTKKVPRALSIILIYAIILSALLVVLTSLIPLIIQQLSNLANYLIDMINNVQSQGVNAIPFSDILTRYVDQERLLITLQDSLDMMAQNVGNFSTGVLSSLTSVLTNVIAIAGYAVTILIATFFMVIDEDAFEKFVLSLIPRGSRPYIKDLGQNIGLKLGAWLRGQVVLSFTIGTIAYIIVAIIGVDYAFTLAIITALTEFVPIVGPLVAAVPATLIALSQSPTLGLITLICYIILNTIESNIIATMIMKKSVGLNPLAVIVSMLIGYQIIGPVGIFLAIPMASALMVIVDDYANRTK